MAISPEKIVSGLVESWQASAALNTLVPGGLWFGAVDQNAVAPYATIAIEHQDTLLTANRYMISTDAIEISLFSSESISHDNRSKINSEIIKVWCERLWSIKIDGASVIGMVPSGTGLTMDPQRRDALDVLITTYNFTIQTQGGF
jgi:hypothetical protein